MPQRQKVSWAQLRVGVMVLVSLILFVIFASFLGGRSLLGPYWPVLIILFGLWVLVRPMLRARRG